MYGKLDLSALELKKKKKNKRQRTEQVPDIGHSVGNPFLLDVLCSVLFGSVLSWWCCCMQARIIHTYGHIFFSSNTTCWTLVCKTNQLRSFDFPRRALSKKSFHHLFLPTAINESLRSNIFAIICNWIYLLFCVYLCVCACKRFWYSFVHTHKHQQRDHTKKNR